MGESKEPRLAPLPRERWGEDARQALEKGFPGAAASFLDAGADAPPIPNVLGTLMHHPELAGAFMAYNRILLSTPTLGHRLREVMVLRVAWRTRAVYEWVQHTRVAAGAGMSREEIEATIHGAEAELWSPLEADLLRATDQLLDGHRIEDETWARLAGELDERQLLEAVFTVGTYSCLAMAFNSFELQLDPGLEPHAGLPLPE